MKTVRHPIGVCGEAPASAASANRAVHCDDHAPGFHAPADRVPRRGLDTRNIVRPTVGLLTGSIVARPLDPDSHALRREAYLDVTQRLIQTRGYEQFSVQDVLDAVGASKGAFYHYYNSKDALLDDVVDRMADQATERLEPVLSDPALTAVEKLEALFGGIAQFKSERKDFVLAILKVWLSDDNAIVRDKMRRLVSARLVPWLDRIVEQGIAEGAFSSRYPDFLARVLASLIQAMTELASELWLGRQLGTVTFEEVKRTFDAYLEAFERIVGVRSGSLKFLDEPTLRIWFG